MSTRISKNYFLYNLARRKGFENAVVVDQLRPLGIILGFFATREVTSNFVFPSPSASFRLGLDLGAVFLSI